MEVLTTHMITRWILTHLTTQTRGRRLTVDPAELGQPRGRKAGRTTNALFLARTRDAREAVIQNAAHWITELNAKKLV